MTSKALSFLARYGTAVVVTVLATLQVAQWVSPSKDATLARPVQVPYKPESALPKDTPTVTLPPAEIVAQKPTSRVLARLEKKIGAPLPVGVKEGTVPLLSVREIKDLCHGGKLVLTLEPVDLTKPDGTKTVEATIYPNKVPFFELTLKRELTVGYGKAFGSGDLVGSFVHVALTQSIARTGPVEWSVAAGAFAGQGWHNGYAEIAARVTF